ncbi:MAG: aminopeptidase [Lachnospiraceae bacterium]|nr:aminopeptidase [Lachnospiraceae bacterium]
MEKKNAWLSYTAKELKDLEKLNNAYKTFITESKTERLSVENTVKMAKENGYKDLEDVLQNGEKIWPGDKIYAVGMKKTVAFFHIGKKPLTEGMNILGARIDSPRMDVKQVPLYEDTEFAYLDTHYYGGIKKYQWVTIPLALYGVIVKKDGTVIKVAIGDKEDDPVLMITDLLIHLSQDQMKKTASVVIEGEELDLMVGSKPLKGKEKDAVKEQILKFFKDVYDVDEDDFLSAELEVVPAGKARDMGLDRSMVTGYGQDDRVCAFTSLSALLASDQLERTGVCLLTDKEEIGSVGATGAQSMFFENTVAEILYAMGEKEAIAVRRALKNSKMLSSDVSAAFDPNFPSVMEKKNAAYFGYGVCFNKFTGSRGKSGSNDANPEFIAEIRRILDDNQVRFQTCELGKVDQGGGGTIAYLTAKYGMQVIDAGVPVLSMHAPWEICSKSDIYEAKKAYVAFLKNA